MSDTSKDITNLYDSVNNERMKLHIFQNILGFYYPLFLKQTYWFIIKRTFRFYSQYYHIYIYILSVGEIYKIVEAHI